MALKDQLEAAGYNTSGMDENAMLSKLEAAGYDTSPLTTNQPKGLGAKVWDALAIPEQKSQEGLNMIAKAVPEGNMTGNLVTDVAKGTPKVLAETAAAVAPSFVSRSALLTAGASQAIKGISNIPAVADFGNNALSQIEKFGGMTKGAMKGAMNDPSLITSPGPAEAGKAFEALGKADVTPAVQEKVDVVKNALTKITDGSITPQEAHQARRFTWYLQQKNKSLDPDALQSAYDSFDKIVKEAAPGADAEYQRSLQANSLRQIVPRTKTGDTAQGRSMLMALLSPAKAAVLSPVVQGTAATALGGVSRGLSPVANGLGSGALMEALNRVMARRRGQ